MGDFGRMFADAICGMILASVLVAAAVVGTGTYMIVRWTTPTAEDVEQEKRKRDVIDSLTEEEKQALGL